MSISLLAAAGATLVAAMLTVLLVRRCVRAPRLDVAAWAVAAAGLTLALAAQALGYEGGFTSLTFRVIQLGAQLIAPLGFVWGLVEAGGRHVGGRFAGRLALSALAVIGAVILGSDPLNSTAFGKVWPSPSVFYAVFAHYLLIVLALVTVVWALAMAVIIAVRARAEPEWQRLAPAALAAAGGAVVVQALRLSLPVDAAYPVVSLAAVALAWLAGTRAEAAPVAELREGRAPAREADEWGGRAGRAGRGGRGSRYREYDDTGYDSLYRTDGGGFRPGPDTGEFREVGADTGGYGFYRADTGGFAVDTGSFSPDADWGRYRGDTGSFGAVGADTGGYDQLFRSDDRGGREPGEDRGRDGGFQAAGAGGGAPGVVETGDMMPVIDDILPPGAATGAGVDTDSLYGQIAIYTLLEGSAEDFDRLAKDVVDQVRQREPNTLVYVLHGVPSAPMQRILYEVYRDATAYEDHLRRPYVEHFEEQRKPYVLATNVIELGVRQAKVAPLEDQSPRRDQGDFWTRGQR